MTFEQRSSDLAPQRQMVSAENNTSGPVPQCQMTSSSLGHQCPMTSVHISSGLVLHQMMSDHNSSDLAPQRQMVSAENNTSGPMEILLEPTSNKLLVGTKLHSVTPFPKSQFIPKVVEKNDLSKIVTSHLTTNKIIEKCTKVLALVTNEHIETLQELLEQARALKPLDENLVYACKFVERIRELLVKKNKVESQPRKFKSSSNKNNHALDCNPNIKNVALSKNSVNICLSCYECLFYANHDACVVKYLKDVQKRKKAKSVKQKEKIKWKPTGRIFKTIGFKWIPTGRTVNLVGKQCPPSRNTSTIVTPPGKILTTTVILVDEPCPKLSLRYATSRESLSRSFLNSEIHPFNLHGFGFERILSNEELPPWKFDYLGIVEIVLWYLDYGCSKDMTEHYDNVINFVSKFIGMVRFSNNHFAAIMGNKDLQIGNIKISRVYYIEGIGHNLFSIGQFCD
ncbi:hypothetical protein Tco_1221878 [Tanacetum coccineum]